MPALMAKRLSSERCAIRRELHRRRNLAAPKGGIAKKSSAKQSSASIQKKPSADEPAGPATKKPSSVPTSRPQAGVATSPASILQHAPELSAKMPSAAARPRSSSIRVKKGMTVKVRTRAGVLPTGHCLVLWLAARVVSAAADDDGFLDVMYNGNFPRDDPSRTVRVAMDDVRSMPAMAES